MKGARDLSLPSVWTIVAPTHHSPVGNLAVGGARPALIVPALHQLTLWTTPHGDRPTISLVQFTWTPPDGAEVDGATQRWRPPGGRWLHLPHVDDHGRLWDGECWHEADEGWTGATIDHPAANELAAARVAVLTSAPRQKRSRAAPATPTPWTPAPEAKVKSYKNEREYQRDAERMLADGWQIAGQSAKNQKTAIARTAGKFVLTGGLGLVLMGRSKKGETLTVTWLR
jgi:hypothetical protein